MDYKITKSRLGNFLAYEWILIIVAIVASILIWELVYSVSGVRLTKGQTFAYYYDYGLTGTNASGFHEKLKLNSDDERVLSYDVLEAKYEQMLDGSTQVLPVRLTNHEGDVIFSSRLPQTVDDSDPNAYKPSRANTLIDQYSIYSINDLLIDARAYLKTFLSDSSKDETDFNNLDKSIIEAKFRERMRKDNRYRKDSAMAEGVLDEYKRIETLCNEVKTLEYVIATRPDVFYEYRKYEQSVHTSDAEEYKGMYESEVQKFYGVKMEMLTGGDETADSYFAVGDTKSATGTVLLVFDFKQFQPELQFETISFINMVIRNFSDII